ncbi:MAG: tRNA uridine-5-carboxymethylaminomethyl(34) synthesis GTPase MnmE [Chloroflexi bacterium]|nr:tRNA uridine-5-carboxymethylaminomethyl(34) synthesis GTPase MnmE [Chloroflexota bacterium]
MTRALTDTIAAIATAPGPGGIGIVRASGPEARGVAERVVRFREGIEHPRPRYAHRVDVIDPAPPHAVIDDGLLLFMPGPNSYTGEDVVEFQGHGGLLVTSRVLDAVLRAGARPAEPGEFTLRAFLNGRLDLAQAEAVADLVAAPTAEALAAAADQLGGRLSSSVRELRRACLDLMARLEAEIDFAEEDVPAVPRDDLRRTLERIDGTLEAILAGADRGMLQRHGFRVVLVGSPNVGKSSLMNALLATERAIVTEVPGTTRDVVEESFNLDGIPVRLSDTAGLRPTDDPVERIGVDRSGAALAAADVAALVLDGSRALVDADLDAARQVAAAGKQSIVVLNKTDLPSATTTNDAAGLIEAPVCRTSAINGDVAGVRAALRTLIGDGSPNPDLGTVASLRHKQALERAREELASAREAVAGGLPADFIAIGLRGAVQALGEVTGESATEDLLDTIFAKFCIGK